MAANTPTTNKPSAISKGVRAKAVTIEAGRGVFQQVSITEPPLAIESQRRYRGEDQREQVVEEVADVEQQEMQALAHGVLPGTGVLVRRMLGGN